MCCSFHFQGYALSYHERRRLPNPEKVAMAQLFSLKNMQACNFFFRKICINATFS